MQSKATTVAQYLRELPPDRRAAVEAVRKVVLASIDDGIAEAMQYGMIGYAVPHHVFPNGYHCDPRQPVPYAAIASQKQYMSLYLMCAYMGDGDGESFIRREYARKGKKLDMGKSCIRFKSLDELDLDVIAEAIRRAPSKAFVDRYFAAVGPGAWKSKAAKAPTAKRAAQRAAKAPAKKQ